MIKIPHLIIYEVGKIKINFVLNTFSKVTNICTHVGICVSTHYLGVHGDKMNIFTPSPFIIK